MKKTALVFVLVSVLTACTKNLTKLNVDPKNPTNVPSRALFTEGEHQLLNQITSSSVNYNIFRLIEQQWQETTYTDESNYNIDTRTIPDDVWNALYAALVNLDRAKKVAVTDVDAGSQKSAIAQADVLEIYAYYYLLTTFGNVPYTEALDINKPFPKYDDAATVYADLLKRLDADIAALPSGSGFGAADQLTYNGNPTKWVSFAESLKLKMGMTIADVGDGSAAKTAVQEAFASGKLFAGNADNAIYNYQSGPPNTNPIWVDLVQSGRQDFVACSTMINYMVDTTGASLDSVQLETIHDPRVPYYFTTIDAGPNSAYFGLDPGQNGSFGSYSKPSGANLVSTSIGKITDANFPGDLLDYSEVQFLLAEAVERKFITGGLSEETYYNQGIIASINFWTGSAYTNDDKPPYLVGANVAFGTASVDDPNIPNPTNLQKIAFQKYLALYNRGWDAWIETRRLDCPKLAPPPPDLRQSDFPVRFTYPVNEQNVNVVNYNKAAKAIGGDKVTTKLWFDKFDIGNNNDSETALRKAANNAVKKSTSLRKR